MKQWIITILVVLFLIAVLWASQTNLAYYHEYVHKAIYSSYNISSEVEIDYLFGGGFTSPEEECPVDSECESLHNWNEIISYNMSAFIFNMWCMLIFYIIWKTWKDKRDKRTEKAEKERGKRK